jgi:hypothetical protein
MTSRSTRSRQLRGDRINDTGELAIVSCKYYTKHKLPYKILSLSNHYGNCVCNGILKYEPVEIPLPNFSRVDKEMRRLEAMLAEAKKAEERAFS